MTKLTFTEWQAAHREKCSTKFMGTVRDWLYTWRGFMARVALRLKPFFDAMKNIVRAASEVVKSIMPTFNALTKAINGG